VSAGEDFHTVRLDAGGEPNWLSTLHESTPCDDSNDSCLSGSEVTRIYAGSGKTVGCVFIRYPYTGNAAGQCAFNGYLVNLP